MMKPKNFLSISPIVAAYCLTLLTSVAEGITVGYYRFEEGTADTVAIGANAILDTSGLNRTT